MRFKKNLFRDGDFDGVCEGSSFRDNNLGKPC